MKRIKYIMILIVNTLLLCCCDIKSAEHVFNDIPSGEQDINQNIVQSTQLKETEYIDTSSEKFLHNGNYEYSYITEKGEITDIYETELGEVIEYYSLGFPDSNNFQRYSNGIYCNPDGGSKDNPLFYMLIDTDEGNIKRNTWFLDGDFYVSIDSDIEKVTLYSSDHIEIFGNSDNQEKDVFGWFDYRLVIDGHVYTLEKGSIVRYTVNGNERVILDAASCRQTCYKDGYVYYLRTEQGQRDSFLYRIELNGQGKEQVGNVACSDVGSNYYLTEEGAVYLTRNSNNTYFIIEENFEENDSIIELGKFTEKKYNVYRIAGEINGTVYLSVNYARTITDSAEIEFYSFIDGKLEQIHKSTGIEDLGESIPFVKGNFIYYKTNEGIFQFDPIKDECILVAKYKFSIARVLS